MSLRHWIGAAWSLRRGLKTLASIDQRLAEQNRLLARIADRFAPVPPAVVASEIGLHTSVDHLDPIEAALVDDYRERIRRDTGATPDDDQVLTYLADEKTTDLHSRLVARDQELDRLRRDSRLTRADR